MYNPCIWLCGDKGATSRKRPQKRLIVLCFPLIRSALSNAIDVACGVLQAELARGLSACRCGVARPANTGIWHGPASTLRLRVCLPPLKLRFELLLLVLVVELCDGQLGADELLLQHRKAVGARTSLLELQPQPQQFVLGA